LALLNRIRIRIPGSTDTKGYGNNPDQRHLATIPDPLVLKSGKTRKGLAFNINQLRGIHRSSVMTGGRVSTGR
jgi:hypothetical protein